MQNRVLRNFLRLQLVRSNAQNGPHKVIPIVCLTPVSRKMRIGWRNSHNDRNSLVSEAGVHLDHMTSTLPSCATARWRWMVCLSEKWLCRLGASLSTHRHGDLHLQRDMKRIALQGAWLAVQCKVLFRRLDRTEWTSFRPCASRHHCASKDWVEAVGREGECAGRKMDEMGFVVRSYLLSTLHPAPLASHERSLQRHCRPLPCRNGVTRPLTIGLTSSLRWQETVKSHVRSATCQLRMRPRGPPTAADSSSRSEEGPESRGQRRRCLVHHSAPPLLRSRRSSVAHARSCLQPDHHRQPPPARSTSPGARH